MGIAEKSELGVEVDEIVGEVDAGLETGFDDMSMNRSAGGDVVSPQARLEERSTELSEQWPGKDRLRPSQEHW